jgi:hypothetical protein
MAKKTDVAPWQDLEEQAYHAYREWHLWLVLRERELVERLGAMKPIEAKKRVEKEEST